MPAAARVSPLWSSAPSSACGRAPCWPRTAEGIIPSGELREAGDEMLAVGAGCALLKPLQPAAAGGCYRTVVRLVALPTPVVVSAARASRVR